MNDTNPYSPPQAEVYTGPIDFRELDFMHLKKLYHRSCNVNAITFLLGLGLIPLIFASFRGVSPKTLTNVIIVGVTIFYAVAVTGLFRRTSWGRIVGIIVCIFSLLSIPLGTIIGIFGLAAFFKAPQLFGANRVTHKELKSEYKLQKAELRRA